MENPQMEEEPANIFFPNEEVSSITSPAPHPLDHLTDQQLIDCVQDLEVQMGHMEVENYMLKNFIETNDMSLLDGFQLALDIILGRAPPPPHAPIRSESKRSARDSCTPTFYLEGKGPKLNLSQKMDMVLKLMEDIQTKQSVFMTKCKKQRRVLKAELEEYSIREQEMKEARDFFEFNVVVHGVDKLTQRIPAEKFIKFMDDLLRGATFNIEKLRLRTASLKIQYQKVSTTLVQRQELGENVHPVDFDQLEIENKHFLQKIEQEKTTLIELKKINGLANLTLSKHKKYLHKQQMESVSVREKIQANRAMVDDLERELEGAEQEHQRAQERYDKMLDLVKWYRVPEVMEYIKVKTKLYDIKKNIKIWRRRNKIQDIALTSCIRQMSHVTGRPYHHTWLNDHEDKESMTFYLD